MYIACFHCLGTVEARQRRPDPTSSAAPMIPPILPHHHRPVNVPHFCLCTNHTYEPLISQPHQLSPSHEAGRTMAVILSRSASPRPPQQQHVDLSFTSLPWQLRLLSHLPSSVPSSFIHSSPRLVSCLRPARCFPHPPSLWLECNPSLPLLYGPFSNGKQSQAFAELDVRGQIT